MCFTAMMDAEANTFNISDVVSSMQIKYSFPKMNWPFGWRIKRHRRCQISNYARIQIVITQLCLMIELLNNITYTGNVKYRIINFMFIFFMSLVLWIPL